MAPTQRKKEQGDKCRQQEIYHLHERLRKVHSKYKQDLLEERKKREKEEEIRELEKEISRSKETFQDTLHGLAPKYISDIIDRYKPTRSLRSSSSNLLRVPLSNSKTYGDRAFSIAAPTLWNALPR